MTNATNLTQAVETHKMAYHANQRTPGCSGIMEARYYRATLLQSKNNYIKCPVEVEVKVWVFGVDGSWATYTVRQGKSLVWVTAIGAVFTNVTAIN